MFEELDAGRVVLGWTIRAREVPRSALDALAASAKTKGGAWLVAVQGALIEPLAGGSVFVGVEVVRQAADDYFESGLESDDAETLEGASFTSAQIRDAKKEVVASSTEVLGWVKAQGLELHPEGPALYLLASGAETCARLTGPGLSKPFFNGPHNFGPGLVKTKGTTFTLFAWGQPV
jgi:hypothetical protein